MVSYATNYQRPAYPQTVKIPALPYQNNQYQLPDIQKQGKTGYINNYYSQNAYFNNKVIVKDYYNLQPYHHRDYIYGGAHTSISPVISSTSGYIPQFVPPTVNFNYGGYGAQQYGGGYHQPNYGGYAPQPRYGGYQPQPAFCGYQQNNPWG